jgi:hypothetical protein
MVGYRGYAPVIPDGVRFYDTLSPSILDGVRFYDTLSPFRLHFRTRNAGIALVCFGTVLLLAGMIASN